MRFWANVRKSDGCWNWIGRKVKSTKKLFYGTLKIGEHGMLAHRFSWELHNGEIPLRKQVLHKCDNGLCVRPDHLFIGTQLDNVRDMIAKGRRVYGRVVLTPEQRAIIKKRYVPYCRKNGASALADEMGLNVSTVTCAATGRRWKDK